MKVYRNSRYESRLSNEQFLDMVNALCARCKTAFILSEFSVDSHNIKKVGNFTVKYGHYVLYRVPGRNEMYSFRTNGTYMTLCRVNNSPDYALCGIIVSTFCIVPDGYSYVGEL